MSDGLFNLARMTVSSSGTGTITLNAAAPGFLTFDLAGASTAAAGERVTYAINDTNQSEIGRGVYYSSGPSLTRGSSTGGMKSTNSNSPINMSNAAQVFITPSANDLSNNLSECYLDTPSATTLTLRPYNGNRLTINGVNETIPTVGVSLASTAASLSSSTYYFVYAYMSSGVMSLDASTAAYTTGPNGMYVKSTDPTRTLVGLTFTTTTAGGSSNWATGLCETASWFNPRMKTATAGGSPTYASAFPGEMSSVLRVPFVNFTGRQMSGFVDGVFVNGNAFQNNSTFLTINTTTTLTNTTIVNDAITGAGSFLMFGSTSFFASDGRYYATTFAQVSAGTLSFLTFKNGVTIWG